MRELKVEKNGETTALLLDEEALKMLGASVGDSFILTEYEEGYRVDPEEFGTRRGTDVRQKSDDPIRRCLTQACRVRSRGR